MTGPVTALGIRDGDPAVLRALIARRGSAVLAYCERACAPAQVADAAADAFARFRALVVASPRPADLDPEAALLSSTRHATAERAPRAVPPPSGAGFGKLLAGRPTADQITLVPELLIARADGTLDPEGEEQLNRLLDASAAARAAEERFRTAEHAYRSAPPRPLPPEIVDHIVATMVTVPVPPEPAAPPAVDAPPPAEEPPAVAEEPPVAEQPPFVAEQPPPVVAEQPPQVVAEQPPQVVGEEPLPEEPSGGDVQGAAPGLDEPGRAAGSVAGAVSMGEAQVERSEGAVVAEESPQVAPEPQPEPQPANGAGDPSVEWDAQPEQIGPQEPPDVEIAAARLSPREADEAQRATPARRPSPARRPPPQRAAAASAAPSPPPARPGLPGKGALAPAAAVVAVAAVSILATSGVFGGSDPQPPVDTGIAPKRTQVQVPEGEAAAIVGELRRAADAARRQRLADERGRAPAAIPPPVEEEPEPTPDPAPEPRDEAPAPEAGRDEEAQPPADAGGDEAPADEAPAEEDAAPTP